MHSDGMMKAQLDKLIADNSERAKKHNIEITFDFWGSKYTVRPCGSATLAMVGNMPTNAPSSCPMKNPHCGGNTCA